MNRLLIVTLLITASCVSKGIHPDEFNQSALYLQESVLLSANGDAEILFDKWIRPKIALHPSSLTSVPGVPVTSKLDMIKNQQALENGFERFCSSVQGVFSIDPERYGKLLKCHDQSGEVIGNLSYDLEEERNGQLYISIYLLSQKYYEAKAAQAIRDEQIKHVKPSNSPPSPPRQSIDKRIDIRDEQGRKIIKGPVGADFYTNVHIISQNVGVIAYGPTSISNSMIEAPVCVQTSGQWLTLNNNELLCDLCIEYLHGPVIENSIVNNTCAGKFSNQN